MSESNRRMLAAFASYEQDARIPDMHNIMQQYPGTRLYRVVRIPDGWRVWLATRDHIYGSFLELHNSGLVTRHEVRPDDGEESFVVRPSDDDIMRMQGSGSAATTTTADDSLHADIERAEASWHHEGSTNTTRLVLDKDNEDNT